MPWSRVNPNYSLLWVQHSLSATFTAYYVVARSTVCHSRPVSSLGRSCCTEFSAFAQIGVNRSIECPLPSRLPPQFDQSRPPDATRNSLNHGLQVYLETRSITAFKFARSLPPPISTHSLDHCLEVHLQSRSITPSNCISKLASARPPSASANSLDHGFQVYLQTRSMTASKLARSWPPSTSTHSLDDFLQVHLQTCSITAYNCISTLAWLQAAPVSPTSLDHSFQMHLHTRWIAVSRAAPNSLNHGLQVDLQTRSITALECIHQFTSWWFQVHLQAGQDRVCISYNEMSIYPGVSEIYSACRCVRHRYSCLSECIYVERLR